MVQSEAGMLAAVTNVACSCIAGSLLLFSVRAGIVHVMRAVICRISQPPKEEVSTFDQPPPTSKSLEVCSSTIDVSCNFYLYYNVLSTVNSCELSICPSSTPSPVQVISILLSACRVLLANKECRTPQQLAKPSFPQPPKRLEYIYM